VRPIILESPLAGNVRRNTAYARAAMRHALEQGDAPMVSHLLYTQCLDDEVPEERALGIEAGLCWGPKATATVVYVDLGVSPGMKFGIERAEKEKRPVEFRTVPGWKWPQ
jgi:hypothetical protein